MSLIVRKKIFSAGLYTTCSNGFSTIYCGKYVKNILNQEKGEEKTQYIFLVIAAGPSISRCYD